MIRSLRRKLRQRFVAKYHHGTRIRDHVFEPLLRILGIQRQVCGSRLQRSERSHDEVERPLHADAYEIVRPCPGFDETVRNAVRPCVQFAIADGVLSEDERDGVRVSRNL